MPGNEGAVFERFPHTSCVSDLFTFLADEAGFHADVGVFGVFDVGVRVVVALGFEVFLFFLEGSELQFDVWIYEVVDVFPVKDFRHAVVLPVVVFK